MSDTKYQFRSLDSLRKYIAYLDEKYESSFEDTDLICFNRERDVNGRRGSEMGYYSSPRLRKKSGDAEASITTESGLTFNFKMISTKYLYYREIVKFLEIKKRDASYKKFTEKEKEVLI